MCTELEDFFFKVCFLGGISRVMFGGAVPGSTQRRCVMANISGASTGEAKATVGSKEKMWAQEQKIHSKRVKSQENTVSK